MRPTADIAIIGAGAAGLACARHLQAAGRSFVIYEASETTGGRLRTDVVEGFKLDRGFQVFLPASPDIKQLLDYDALELRSFYRGAVIHWAGQQHRLADPLHHPLEAMRRLSHPLVPWRDKWLMLLLRKHLYSLKELPRDVPEMPTIDYLREWGFSEVFINHFMRPFFGGVFMDRELTASSRIFQFLFSLCDYGGTSLPAQGMQAVTDQLVARLPTQCFAFNSPVATVRSGEIRFDDGEVVHPKHIIMAVGEDEAARFVPEAFTSRPLRMRSTTSLYFTTDKAPPCEPILHIDGDLHGPVNHACWISRVAPERAPEGRHLFCASVLGTPSGTGVVEVVREQMRSWFGPQADDWQHLRTCQVKNAQSAARQMSVGASSLRVKLAEGLYRCGDYCEDVSLNGAFASARKAAEACLQEG